MASCSFTSRFFWPGGCLRRSWMMSALAANLLARSDIRV
ncbi:hypothetical protein CSE45_2800 [Citreicella sp. SE45]|nr:hypothetical protein CSE45_2800 [Citreicella sp. SE45]